MTLPLDPKRSWFALYTKPRHEKRVLEQLERKELEAYLPLHSVLRQWSDRRKWVDEPLFRSYIFIKGNSVERYEALRSYGALRLVSFRNRPIEVWEEEIERIKLMLKEAPCLERTDYFTPGSPVRIMRGPLAGLEGVLQETRNDHRVVIRIESVRQAVRFSVDVADISVL